MNLIFENCKNCMIDCVIEIEWDDERAYNLEQMYELFCLSTCKLKFKCISLYGDCLICIYLHCFVTVENC